MVKYFFVVTLGKNIKKCKVKKLKNNYIDGKVLKGMLFYGLQKLKSDVERINDLNVFPIPDGDTGDNMYSTILGGVNAINDIDEDNIGKVGALVRQGMLLGARGNSGVILSQMFAGFTESFDWKEKITVPEFANAFLSGVKTAYASVAKPVEGTILTVIREAAEGAKEFAEVGLIEYLQAYIEKAKISLENTPNLLQDLKEAGVVDSGGAGVILIVEGFLSFAKGEKIDESTEVAVTDTSKNKSIDFSLFTEDSEMVYGYCTEFLLQLTHKKTDISKFSLENMKSVLHTFGDSLVAVKNGSIVKVHVHTMTPGAVLSYAQQYGEFLTLKIENMTLQHNETVEKKLPQTFKKSSVRKEFALVAVANGSGVTSVFKELGADLVIDGGQGNNPSVEVFLTAYDAVNADNVFVLPNNNNIIMAATEAGGIFKDSVVKVIPTKSFGEGYAVLSDLDYTAGDVDEIESNMLESVNACKCLMVAKSNRDANFNGIDVVNGNYIGFCGKTVLSCKEDKTDCVVDLLSKVDLSNYSFLVTFFGDGISDEEKEKLQAFAQKELSDLEFYVLDGGQEIYDFVIVLE